MVCRGGNSIRSKNKGENVIMKLKGWKYYIVLNNGKDDTKMEFMI